MSIIDKPIVKTLMLKGEKGDPGDLDSTAIVDNLTTNRADKVLSAKQGKVLNDKIDDVNAIKPSIYDTVALMKADTKLSEGQHVKTKGYYESNDGGAAEYIITDTQSESDYQENLNNGLYATLFVDDIIYVEQIGCKGDSTTDNYTRIFNILKSNKKIILGRNKTYFISNPIRLEEVNNLYIEGNNSILKFNGYANENVGNNGFLNFENCYNITLNNLKINGNIEWIERPYSWEEGYSNYTTLRNKTYDGFRFVNCDDININNCKATKIKVGFHFSGTTNSFVNNCESSYTMADGVLIHGGCNNINVENHYVNYSNDDQFSMVHEANDTNYVNNCSYTNCYAENSFGACCVMQECINCNAYNCISINNKDVPFKMGTSLGTFACKNCTMDSIKVISENTIQGTSANLSTAESNGTMAIAYVSGAVDLENCKIINSTFIETSGNNLSLYNPNHSGLSFINCLFEGINLVFVNLNNILFDKCTINSNDGNVLTNSSATFRNCIINDNVTYSTRGKRALSCNNCHNIILDKVELIGKTNDVTNLLSLYSDSTDYSTAYVDVNDVNLTITNMVDIYKNGVLKLSDISNFGYGRFREGQLLYFESNDGLYIVTSTGWTKLNS